MPGRRTDDRHRAREPGQVQRRLAGGVAAAHHDDVVALHLAGRGHRGAVVDAGADQVLERGYAELAVGDAARDEDGPGPDVAAVGAEQVRGRPPAPGSSAVTSQPVKNCGAEAERLVAGALRQPHPGDAAGEAEVVADHRAGAGLAADRLGLQDDDREPFGGSVDRRRQPGRPAADDREVDDLVDLEVAGTAVDRDRHVADARGLDRHPVGRNDEGPAQLLDAELLADPVQIVLELGSRRGARPGSACPSGRGSRGSPSSASRGSAR